MAARALGKRQARYRGLDLSRRPFFIDEKSWQAFTAYVLDGKTVLEVATESGFSTNWIRRILRDVEEQLLLPRPSPREWLEVTVDSPAHDLGLSLRSLNQLRDVGCSTVADVLNLDLAGPVIGAGARDELFRCLRRHGLHHAADTAVPSEGEIKRLENQLKDLEYRMERNAEMWRRRVRSMEAKLQKLSSSHG